MPTVKISKIMKYWPLLQFLKIKFKTIIIFFEWKMSKLKVFVKKRNFKFRIPLYMFLNFIHCIIIMYKYFSYIIKLYILINFISEFCFKFFKSENIIVNISHFYKFIELLNKITTFTDICVLYIIDLMSIYSLSTF